MTLRGVWTKPWTKFENKKLFSNYRPPFCPHFIHSSYFYATILFFRKNILTSGGRYVIIYYVRWTMQLKIFSAVYTV